MKNLVLIPLMALAVVAPSSAQVSDSSPITLNYSGGSRIKDLIDVEGARDNQLNGYGLVVGLAGTGDSKIDSTLQTIANALKNFGVNVPMDDIKSGNVAAVMVTAEIPPFVKPGTRIDVTISSIGDSKTLQGGVLLQVPLQGADKTVYAVAQGAIAVGGFLGGQGGPGGATVQKNHPTVATIPNGAIVEREIPTQIVSNGSMNLMLRDADFTSAARMAEAINRVFPNTAVARDSKTINVLLPPEYSNYEVNFLATIGSIEVEPDTAARVVINERTGVIVATSNVRVSKVAVSHGSLTISVASNLTASQPNGSFFGNSAGTTEVLNSTTTDVNEQKGSFKLVEEAPTIEKVATALNALGVSTRDMMSIFQTMKRAGALQAELVLN
ncbi:MAG: flagellar basal body P-ring protein FlgI [Verrucomicrobia bacterium]|nr:flagellar basal body P-ring protein FlgI [Verrucomicrobiota bacterium]